MNNINPLYFDMWLPWKPQTKGRNCLMFCQGLAENQIYNKGKQGVKLNGIHISMQ